MSTLYDRVKVTTATTGTGTLVLGSAVSGARSFSSASVANNSVVSYVIEDGANWETGNGTYFGGNTSLLRNVAFSSNNNLAINLSGSATVFIAPLANDFNNYAPLNSPAFTGTPTVPTAASGTNNTQAASTAYANDADTRVSGINTQTGTSYTFVLGDAGNIVEGNNASAITFTIPTNANVAYKVNTVIEIVQIGAGQITLSPAGGVTLLSAGGAVKLRVQYSAATIYKRGTDNWLLAGDIV